MKDCSLQQIAVGLSYEKEKEKKEKKQAKWN